MLGGNRLAEGKTLDCVSLINYLRYFGLEISNMLSVAAAFENPVANRTVQTI